MLPGAIVDNLNSILESAFYCDQRQPSNTTAGIMFTYAFVAFTTAEVWDPAGNLTLKWIFYLSS